MLRSASRRWSLVVILTVALCGLVLPAGTASAATVYYVGTTADDAGAPQGICTDPLNTVCTLRRVIGAAAPGDTILFKSWLSGTITLTNGPLTLTKSVTITGPGAANLTISGNNAGQVFVVNSGVTATISDLTVSRGRAQSDGGGIDNSGVLTLKHSTVSQNVSVNYGGGIGNRAGGTLTLLNVTVSGNDAGQAGGGVSNIGGTVTVENSTIAGNTAFQFGGGLYNWWRLTVRNSAVTGNSTNTRLALPSRSLGGGIYNHPSAQLTLTTSTLSDNTAIVGGGIANDGTATVTSSTVAGNTATFTGVGESNAHGGGISNVGSLTVTNSTISGNAAGATGGGINNASTILLDEVLTGSAALTNTTVADNTAHQGGGIFAYSGVTLTNTVVAGNRALSSGDQSGPDIWAVPQTLIHGGNNLIGNATNVPNLIASSLRNVDARLGPLADNGGPTLTHAVLAGSPAIDAGDSAVCARTTGAAPVEGKDQRGYPRPAARCSIGAHENGTLTQSFAPSLPASVWALTSTPYDAAGNFRMSAYNWSTGAWTMVDGGARRLAVGPDGQPWVVTAQEALWRRTKVNGSYVNGQWERVTAVMGVKDLAIGPDGVVWLLYGTADSAGDFPMVLLNPNTTPMHVAQIDGRAVGLAVGPDGQPWAVTGAGALWQRSRGTVGAFNGTAYHSGTWSRVAIGVVDVAVGGDGRVWMLYGAVDSAGNYDIKTYTPDTGDWTEVPGDAKAIAAGPDGHPWVVTGSGRVWRTVPRTNDPLGFAWGPADGVSARDIAVNVK
jgi:hypothetical protein